MIAHRYRIFSIVSLLVFIADFVSKKAAVAWLEYTPHMRDAPVVVIPNFFEWQLAYNKGSAFGLFQNMESARIWLSIFGVLALFFILNLIRTAKDNQTLFIWAISFMFGGAVGNILDRFSEGSVVDFIVFRYYEYAWPTFNIADTALCIGVGLLLLESFQKEKEDFSNKESSDEASASEASASETG